MAKQTTHTQPNKIFKAKNQRLKMLNQIALDSIKEEELLSEKLFSDNLQQGNDTLGQKMADKVAAFGGSWFFILIFSGVLILWIFLNTLVFISHPFDPYPFILLNLVLSSVAALQAPIIMMSQNRKEEKEHKRAENDYLINLKGELEIRMLHQKIDSLLKEEIVELIDIQKKQMKELAIIKGLNKSKNNISKE